MAGRLLRDVVQVALGTTLLAVFAQTFLLRAFVVPSDSMEPSILIGDHLLVNRYIHRAERSFPLMRPVGAGDVVVFRYPQDQKQVLVKRCVAVAGDRVEIRDKELLVNGVPAFTIRSVFRDPHTYPSSRFLEPPLRSRDNFGPIVVPAGEIFVMGDNRDRSLDSRSWGTVSLDLVLGSARLVYWSRARSQSSEATPSGGPDIRWQRIGQTIH